MNQSGIDSRELSNSSGTCVLSVVVASAHSEKNLDSCLDSIVQQRHDRNVEIIVSHCGMKRSVNEMKDRYPGVIFILMPETSILPDLWGAGIRESSGGIIAITESGCIADKNWISNIIEAHQSPSPVIGGAVEIFGSPKLVDWAAFFCEYGQFMQPLRKGVSDELPGNNISFKRSALEKGREHVGNGFWKTYWCRKIRDEGIELVLEPSIIVRCKISYQFLPFLTRRYHHGRCFAGMRNAGLSHLTRTVYMFGSLLLPVIFLMRILRSNLPKRRHVKEFIMSFPVSVMAVAAWSAGEFCGYASGKGVSCSYVY